MSRSLKITNKDRFPPELRINFQIASWSLHEVQDTLDDHPEFDLTGVCETDEISVVAGEKGLDQDEPRDRGL